MLEIKETNIAKKKNIIVELPVEKKLPEVRSGKNSTTKTKKKGKILSSEFLRLRLDWNVEFIFTKYLYKIENTRKRIILKPTTPSSVKISK